MPKPPLDFDALRELALELPEVETGTSYGSEAVKVRGNVLASVPVNKTAEPNSAVFRVDFCLRSSLIEERPDLYYLTPHYEGYPTVLVRLSKINRGELRKLIALSWNFVSAKKPARKKTATRKRSR